LQTTALPLGYHADISQKVKSLKVESRYIFAL